MGSPVHRQGMRRKRWGIESSVSEVQIYKGIDGIVAGKGEHPIK